MLCLSAIKKQNVFVAFLQRETVKKSLAITYVGCRLFSKKITPYSLTQFTNRIVFDGGGGGGVLLDAVPFWMQYHNNVVILN